MKTAKLILMVLLINGFYSAKGQEIRKETPDTLPSRAEGVWKGKLTVLDIDMPLVFKVARTGAQNLKVTLDSPLQQAYDIELGGITIKNGDVIIEAPRLQGRYTAKFVNDTILTGIWGQAGKEYPLTLVKIPGSNKKQKDQD